MEHQLAFTSVRALDDYLRERHIGCLFANGWPSNIHGARAAGVRQLVCDFVARISISLEPAGESCEIPLAERRISRIGEHINILNDATSI
jgi:hypothetical protein